MVETYDEYADLQGAGFTSSEPVPPEEEFFHSVYVSGQTRKNHINIEEQAGKIQIRGVEYNLDEVNIVITHTKDILAKIITKGKKDSIECFSFKKGQPPYYGTSKLGDGSPRVCPSTSAERSVDSFCNECRAQIIVAGIYCTANGAPILGEDKKPTFVFIRGKGMKYSNVSNYLGERFKEDLSPIFEPVTDQSKAFEKAVVNNKRYVTKITRGQESSNFGMKDVFILEKGIVLPKEPVLQILKVSKQTLEKFEEKFDWSRRSSSTTGYTTQAEGVLKVDGTPGDPPAVPDFSSVNVEEGEEKPQTEDKTFSFDNIKF